MDLKKYVKRLTIFGLSVLPLLVLAVPVVSAWWGGWGWGRGFGWPWWGGWGGCGGGCGGCGFGGWGGWW